MVEEGPINGPSPVECLALGEGDVIFRYKLIIK
jgi:hypothetical protein